MRIKHWAGYGCVNARKVNDHNPFTMHIKVEGNHERGIENDDEYGLYTWLVRRFDKDVPDFLEWIHSNPIIEIKPGWRTDPILGVIDTCDYYFTY